MRKLHDGLLFALAAVLAFNPVYIFLAIVLRGILPGGLINIVKFFPYLVMVTGVVIAGYWRWRQSDVPVQQLWRKTPNEIKWAVLLLGWCVLNMLWSPASTWQSLRGLNVDFGGLILFVIIWLLQPSAQWFVRWRWVIWGTLVGLVVLAIPESIANHAFRVWSGHDLLYHYVVQVIPQLRSLTSGPNPFGTLLVLLAAASAWIGFRWQQRTLALAMAPFGVVLGLTYARSAWIGGAIGLGGYFFYQLIRAKKFVWWPVVFGLTIFLGASFGAARYHANIIDVLTHGKSTEQHATLATTTVGQAAKSRPDTTFIGVGLGTAGPVVFGTSEATRDDVGTKISESWYLQLFQEIGAIGLALYCVFYFLVVRKLLGRNSIIGWLAVGLAVNAITLHTWSADGNLNVMFWTLAALALYGPAEFQTSSATQAAKKSA